MVVGGAYLSSGRRVALTRHDGAAKRPLAATPPFADIQELPSDLWRRATSGGERPLAASDLLRRATSCGERPLAASDLLRFTPDVLFLTHRLN